MAAADDLEAAASRLRDMLAAFASAPGLRSLDPRAVFQGIARACGPMADAAAELGRQDWVDIDPSGEDGRVRWDAALSSLRECGLFFEEVSDGWI